MFQKIMLITPLFLVMLINIIRAEEVKIHTAPGKYQDYYHIKYTLTPENTLLALKGYDKYGTSKYEFDDGLFQVFIPKDRFPVSAPNCKGYIILRMPMTMTESPKKDEWIAEKRVLYEKIKMMKESGKGSVDVVVELNPESIGVKVMTKDPLMVELEGANVYFRHANGRYIDYVGPLKDK